MWSSDTTALSEATPDGQARRSIASEAPTAAHFDLELELLPNPSQDFHDNG